MVPTCAHAQTCRTDLQRAAMAFPELLKLLCTSIARGSGFNAGQGRGPRASSPNMFRMTPRLLDRGATRSSAAPRSLWAEGQQRVPAPSQVNSGRRSHGDPHLTLGVGEDLFSQKSFSDLPDLCNHLGNSKNTAAGSHLDRLSFRLPEVWPGHTQAASKAPQ